MAENKKDKEEINVKATDYTSENIQILKGLEGVRKRPSMYIGSTGNEGYHHLVWEIVDNSIDEALAGHCNKIKISINKDNSMTIEDNGRGIPTGIHKEYNKPTLEVMITHLHAGGKFNKGSYAISGGLHGVGMSVVAALSSNMKFEIVKGGNYHSQNFGRGKILDELKTITIDEYFNSAQFKDLKVYDVDNGNGNSNDKNPDEDEEEDDIGFQFLLGTEENNTGTRITFIPDPEIFQSFEDEEMPWNYKIINNHLRDLAYLNPTLEIEFYDEKTKEYNEHHYEGGISEFVEFLNKGNKLIFEKPIYIHDNKDGVDVEIALQYSERYLENIISFVNNVATHEGGTHLTGFKMSLTRLINTYLSAMNNKKLKGIQFQGNDTREGLTAIISVKVPEPQFEGQTKTKLGNEEVTKIVSGIMGDQLGKFLEENPGIAKKIVNKCMIAEKSRIAAKKARDNTRRKSALSSGRLPGKLADCSSNDPVICELFIVEGDSAGGSAKQGRDRIFQAILPLRGKILNVEKASPHKIHENKEILAMISAIGTGTYVNDESGFNLSKLRYNKIISMCDADVDGHHIETLMLTFFFRYMRPLIDAGNIYVAVPPLYKVSYKKTSDYIYEEKNLSPFLEKVIEKYKLEDSSKIKIQRFKGLGEMNPEELWETTMDPSNRRLKQLKYTDYAESHHMFSTLMGEEVKPRKQYIMEHYKDVQNLDI